jgi:hypothetical protein
MVEKLPSPLFSVTECDTQQTGPLLRNAISEFIIYTVLYAYAPSCYALDSRFFGNQ